MFKGELDSRHLETKPHVVKNTWLTRGFPPVARRESLFLFLFSLFCSLYVCMQYFPHAHFIPIIVGVEKRGGYLLLHGDLPRQHPFGTAVRFTDPMPADSWQ